MLNRVILIGRLTKDPELKYTGNGVPNASFTIAVDRPFKTADKTADFIRIEVWRKPAEMAKQHLHKGRLVAVEGRLQINQYDKDGERRSITSVVADDIRYLDRAAGSGNSPGDSGGQNTGSTGAGSNCGQPQSINQDPDIDEEIDLSEEPF